MNAFTFPSQSAIFKRSAGGDILIDQLPLATETDGSDWTSAKVVRADVAKSYIDAGGADLSDLYLDGRLYGLEAGASVSGDDFEDACAAAAAANKTLVTPAGLLTLSSNSFVYGTGNLRIMSFGGTTLQLNANLHLQAVWGPQGMLLAADAARRDYTIEVDDATVLRSGVGLEVGDLIHIDTDTVIETGWGYHKQCVRRVIGISGNVLKLDELLFFPFTVAEGTVINVFKPREVIFENIAVNCADQKSLTFDNTSRAVVRDCPFTGPAAKWLSPVYSDGLKFATCDNVLVHNSPQYNMRYSPFFSTTRNFIYEDSWIRAIRHPDCNLYSEHGYYKRIRSRGTDNLIQMHPSIDINFEACGGLIDGA